MRMFALLPEYSKSFLWHILHKKSRDQAVFAVDHGSFTVFYGNEFRIVICFADCLKIRLSHTKAADIGTKNVAVLNLVPGTPAGNILPVQAVNEATVFQNVPYKGKAS